MKISKKKKSIKRDFLHFLINCTEFYLQNNDCTEFYLRNNNFQAATLYIIL